MIKVWVVEYHIRGMSVDIAEFTKREDAEKLIAFLSEDGDSKEYSVREDVLFEDWIEAVDFHATKLLEEVIKDEDNTTSE